MKVLLILASYILFEKIIPSAEIASTFDIEIIALSFELHVQPCFLPSRIISILTAHIHHYHDQNVLFLKNLLSI